MEIRPILSTLMRNRTGALLIALQIALTMAVIINSVFIILDRAATMRKPIGIDSDHLIVAQIADLDQDLKAETVVADDLRRLLEIDGVQSATRMSTMPLSNSGSNTHYRPKNEDGVPSVSVAYYSAGPDALRTLGLELTRGRYFSADEIVYDSPENYHPAVAVLADASAEALFPDEDPIGKFIYTDLGEPIEIIGTIRMLARPWYGWGDFYTTMLIPNVDLNHPLVIRVAPEDRERLVPEIEEALGAFSLNRLVGNVRTQEAIIARTYQRDAAMNKMLGVVMLLVVSITALGIIGLASFSVAQRKRQIGTRRAIGARRFHILRYFLVENWLITTGGIVLGLLLSFIINHFLVTEYQMPKLDPVYLPLLVLGLWGIGLLATLGPARRAMSIEPAIATRNV